MTVYLLLYILLGIQDSLPQMPGWPKYVQVVGNDRPTGVTLADVDQDGNLEIIQGSSDRSLHVWDFAGNYLPGWPVENMPDLICSKCAIGDIDTSYSGLEIVVAGKNSMLMAYHNDGTIVSGWPQIAGEISPYKSPVLFDLDLNGDLEIIIGLRDYPNGKVLVFHHDGTLFPGWPQPVDYMCVATPSVGDVDNDGNIEICALSYHSVYMWDIYGNCEVGWPLLNISDGCSDAQLVLADFDNDSDMEIVHTYYMIPPELLIGVYQHDGNNFLNWPYYYPGGSSFTTPVCADIDNDGDLEIFGTGKVNGFPSFLARHHTGDTVMGWPVLAENVHSTPIVFDLDLNDSGKMEILIADGHDQGTFYAYNDDGSIVPGWPIYPGCTYVNSPAVGDVDNDGDVEIALVHSSGRVNLWTIDGVEFRPYSVEWGSWFHDNWNTGWYHPKAPQNVHITNTVNWIRLTWNSNTESDIAGYNVYRASTTGGPYAKLTDTLLTQTIYYDVPPDTNIYYYCVTARIYAETESRLSEEVWGNLGIMERNVTAISTINVYPTIFTRTISFYGSTGERIIAEVMDIKGAVIDNFRGIGVAQWSPGDNIPAGVYFIKIITHDQSAIRKVIKIR